MTINEEKKLTVMASMDPTKWMQENFAFDEYRQDTKQIFGNEEPEEEIVFEFKQEGNK